MSTTMQIKEVAPLTAMQRGMLHQALLHPDSGAYHEQLLLQFEGPLDADRMEQAWQQVVDRHDALRGRFSSQRVSSPVHVIPVHELISLLRHRLGALDAAGAGGGIPATVQALLDADAAQPFDLETEHALRLVLLSHGAGQHWLLWSFHHILVDGWSMGLVLEQVLAAYGGEAGAPAADAAPYRRWLAQRDQGAALDHWQAQLAGFDSHGLAPPVDAGDAAARPDGPLAPLQQAEATLDAADSDSLHALARSHRASLHHVLLCGWALTLGRYTDQHDVLVPTVLAGRPPEVADADAMVGLFMNTVPMRVQWSPGDSFGSLLQRVRDVSLDAAMHQHLSLAEIQARTGPLPIDHVFLMQGLPFADLIGRRCGPARVCGASFRESVPYPLQVSITPSPGGIAIALQGQHPAIWLQTLADNLRGLLAEVAAQALQPVAALQSITPAQRRQVLAWGDGGPAAHPGTVLDAIQAQVTRTPGAVALVCDRESLTYRQLDARANQLAHTLLAQGPLPADTPVALVSHRDAGLVIGLLAILRAGATYLPVDPAYPAERIRLMLEASGCGQILISPGLEDVLPQTCSARVLRLDAADADAPTTAPDVAVGADQLAYLIFTSGSTGTPKGVMLSHGNAASVLAAIPRALQFSAHERVLGATTVSFDISLLELLGTLSWGCTLVLASATQARDPALLLDLMQRERVSVLQATPTRLRLLLDAANTPQDAAPAAFATLRHVLVGGEALPQALADDLLKLASLRVANVYGPTETAIWSAWWPLAPGPVRIGKALAGERLLVLSRERELQAPGAIGEIAIAGAGVARGYFQDAGRSAERFIAVPGIDGPVYLSGDLGCWCSDGQLAFRGRRDEQVKVRGMRIELADVEHQLRLLPGIQAAAASARRNARGETELLAYLMGPATLDVPALRAQLATRLPDAMIPSHFMLMQALPQTPAGKTDRRALPAPPQAAAAPSAARAASEAEARITAVFCEVLGRPVGPQDDFFLSGGHSLSAIQAVGRVNRALAAGYTLRDLYLAPSAAALAKLPVRSGLPLRVEPHAPDYPLSAQQQALWVLDQLQPDYAGYNVPGAYRVTGALDLDALTRAWAALTRRHSALRTVFVRVDGLPRQKLLDRVDFAIERHTLPAGADPAVLVRAITCRPFDLEQGPLFRLASIALGPGRQLLVLVLHHIISDGWSDAVLTAELATAWYAVRRGEDPLHSLPDVAPIRYVDYACWQQRYLASPLARSHREFWQAKLRHLPRLQLPASGSRCAGLDRPGARVTFALGESQASRWLDRVPARERFAALTAATLSLMHLESGQNDLVLGLPVANRERPELQDQVGLHLNVLPLRLQVEAGDTLSSLQRRCADGILECVAHAEYPFAHLVDELGVSAGAGRHPVFDAMLIFHQHPVPVPKLDGVELAVHDPQSYSSRFDLDVEVWAGDGRVHGFIEYDAGLFTQAQAGGFAARWQQMLLAASDDPAQLLAPLRHTPGSRADPREFLAHAMALDEEF
jgi:amino acid adenylation domain-containing protein